MTGSQREAINILMMMESVTVNADLIAQALGMNPGVLRKHVRDGDYKISKVEICGDRVRFFRKDFLQKIGEMPEDPPERTEMELLAEIVNKLESMVNNQRIMIQLIDEQNDLLHAIHDPVRRNEKIASCGNS